jgi:hypothetical protein
MHGSRRCCFLYRETHKGDIVNCGIKAVLLLLAYLLLLKFLLLKVLKGDF